MIDSKNLGYLDNVVLEYLQHSGYGQADGPMSALFLNDMITVIQCRDALLWTLWNEAIMGSEYFMPGNDSVRYAAPASVFGPDTDFANRDVIYKVLMYDYTFFVDLIATLWVWIGETCSYESFIKQITCYISTPLACCNAISELWDWLYHRGQRKYYIIKYLDWNRKKIRLMLDEMGSMIAAEETGKKCISALQGVRRELVFNSHEFGRKYFGYMYQNTEIRTIEDYFNSEPHLSAVKLREEILGNHTLDDIMKQSSRFKEVSTSGKKETESGKAVV